MTYGLHTDVRGSGAPPAVIVAIEALQRAMLRPASAGAAPKQYGAVEAPVDRFVTMASGQWAPGYTDGTQFNANGTAGANVGTAAGADYLGITTAGAAYRIDTGVNVAASAADPAAFVATAIVTEVATTPGSPVAAGQFVADMAVRAVPVLATPIYAAGAVPAVGSDPDLRLSGMARLYLDITMRPILTAAGVTGVSATAVNWAVRKLMGVR